MIQAEYEISRAYGPRASGLRASRGPRPFSRASAPLGTSYILSPGLFRDFVPLGPSISGFFLGQFIPRYFIVQPSQESPTISQAGLIAHVQILQRFSSQTSTAVSQLPF